MQPSPTGAIARSLAPSLRFFADLRSVIESLPFSGTAPALLAHCNKHSPAQTKLRRPWCRRAVPGRKREISLDVDGQRQVQQRRVILLRVRPEIRLATVPGRNLVLRQAQDEVFLKPHAEPVEVWGRLGARE